MKKLFIFLLVGIFLFSFASALEATVYYDNESGYYLTKENLYPLGAFYFPELDKIFLVSKENNRLIEYTPELNLNNYNRFKKSMIVHEICHKKQHDENRSYSEIECYYKGYKYFLGGSFND